jgi:protein-S-isoprenylcysteine O-methyltransferase Ste14
MVSAAMIRHATYEALALGIFAAGAATFFALFFVVAPYGRHVRPGWGPTVPDRLGWMAMESPSLVWFGIVFFAGPHRGEAAPLALWALWTLHYAHRTLVYPLRTRSKGKRMPVAIVGLALAFNLANATANAAFLSHFGEDPPGRLWSAPFVGGVLLFALGMGINLDADRRLFALRAPGETAYASPRGGLYEFVSCPNYLGEIIEWSGWALASGSLAGAAFAFFTFANLAPRAASHHAWYRRTFPDYPPQRKALIPFVW